MLQGQVTGIPALVQAGLNTFAPTRPGAVADITSDRLFRFLQNFCVTTATLSISGSRANRFALGIGQLTAWFAKAGIRLELPHDSIVVDRSVDLRNSILPNEISQQGNARYVHVRTYLDCTDVAHTNIYDNVTVGETIVDCMVRCSCCSPGRRFGMGYLRPFLVTWAGRRDACRNSAAAARHAHIVRENTCGRHKAKDIFILLQVVDHGLPDLPHAKRESASVGTDAGLGETILRLGYSRFYSQPLNVL